MSSEKNTEKPVLTPVVDENAKLDQSVDMDDGGSEQIVTMQDVLDEQDELEKEYAAVLGGSDHKCCTYSKVFNKYILNVYRI